MSTAILLVNDADLGWVERPVERVSGGWRDMENGITYYDWLGDTIKVKPLRDIAQAIGAVVSAEYHLDDGTDLALTLLEMGTIAPDTPPRVAARIVAQHIEQA